MIAEEIKKWDGRETTLLRDIYGRYQADPAFVPTLIQLTGEVSLQKGSTWLLKHFLEQGGQLPHLEPLLAQFDRIEHWEARLHLLQCLSFLTITETEAEAVAEFIMASLDHKRPFVRAWAYGGLVDLARQHPRFQPKAKAHIDQALATESASVKARIRQATKRGWP